MNTARTLHRYTEAQVAEVCHNTVAALQVIQERDGGTSPSGPWASEPPERKRIVIEAVRLVRQGVMPRELHAAWVREMAALGWVYGPVKDPVRKTHPNMRDYRDLDRFQRDKDKVVVAVVTALTVVD